MSNKLGFVIQARMGSKRLPGKSLEKINNLPILGWIIKNLKKKRKFKNYKIIVATTKLSKDDQIVAYAKKKNVNYFRGSENDVLNRYYECSKKYKLKNVVRLTSDNPFMDTFFLEILVNTHLKNKNDYTSSKVNLPTGIGAEMMTYESLKKSYKLSNSNEEKEHVCNYILNNKNKFKIEILNFYIKSKKIKNLRLTVDTIEDLKFCKSFIKKQNNKLRSSIKFLSREY